MTDETFTSESYFKDPSLSKKASTKDSNKVEMSNRIVAIY